jgi:predicted flap endonuclease-1-like 5' DNA nuclease
MGQDQSLADPFKETLVDADGVVQFDANGQPIQAYPAWCDKSQLLPDYAVDLQYVSWCDKMHRQCVIGCQSAMAGRDHTLQFRRDANGKLDPNGTFADPDQQLNVKYSQEVRLGLNCAMFKDVNGVEHGVNLEPFDYSGRVIFSYKQWQEKADKEIQHVKSMNDTTATTHGWLDDNREYGVYYMNDPLSMLDGVGPSIEQKFLNHGVTNLGEFARMLEHDLALLWEDKVAKEEQVRDWWESANYRIQAQESPIPVDYRQSDNPYQARYGDQWEFHIGLAGDMRGVTSVKHLALHYYNQAKAHFTKHPPPPGIKWYFYHDALSLMTAKECVEELKS